MLIPAEITLYSRSGLIRISSVFDAQDQIFTFVNVSRFCPLTKIPSFLKVRPFEKYA